AVSGSVVYVGGYTLSSESQSFPVTGGVYQATCGVDCTETPPAGQCANVACGKGFLATLPTSALAVTALTYLGGSTPFVANIAMDLVTSIAVDGSGNVYATGTTGNTNFPTAGTPFQSTFAGMIGTNGSKTAGCLGTYPGGIERSGNFPCGD